MSNPHNDPFDGRRRFERFPVGTPLAMRNGSKEVVAELHDISCDGAFIAFGEPALDAPKGTGLRLEFTLPQGFRVDVFGRVVWVRSEADEQAAGEPRPSGCGVQFYGVSEVNRGFIQYHLEECRRNAALAAIEGHVQVRYRVEREPPEKLFVTMMGSLGAPETQELSSLVLHELADTSGPRLLLYLDVSHLEACTREALDKLRAWFGKLRERDLAGVIVGSGAIGVGQVRRLVRETGIADALVGFESTEEAKRFWRGLGAPKAP
jgi:hypothetical protein